MPRKSAGSSSAANAPKATGPAESEEQQICYLDNFLQGACRAAQNFPRATRALHGLLAHQRRD